MTPYRRTLDAFRKFAHHVRWGLEEKHLLQYNAQKIREGNGYNLATLYQRTHAANALGWDVVARADEEHLTFTYRKRPDFTGTP